MTSLSDTLTVGLVLVLLFGSIALYLYTRIQQAEQKISLLESILLDLKMSTEVKSYTELPAHEQDSYSKVDRGMEEAYIPYDIDDEDGERTSNDDDDVFPGALVGSSSPIKTGSPAPSVSSRNDDTNDNEIIQYKSIIADAVKSDDDNLVDSLPSASKISTNYEAMTLKELQTLAKSRGISGAGSMKKGAIIEALKTSDRSLSNPIEPGSGVGSNTFLETSSPFQGSAESE
jgi:hypothetical protein